MTDALAQQCASRLGTTLRGKWKLERLLGVGGMAAVYVGAHRIGRSDAIKILHPEIARSTELKARFEQEARAVNEFTHPGVVEIRDTDVTEDGCPFLVMELLEGESLQERAARLGGLPVDELLRYVDETLDVLAAAHARNIVHRDIKLDNLFVTSDGKLKVLDFGIARVRSAGQALTLSGARLGTAAYMPPEQVRGQEVDGRADVFAVGALMFRVLAKRRIHEASTEAELLVKMAQERAPPLRSVAPDVPEDVALIVDRALAFEALARYPSALAMQGDVRAVREGEPPAFAMARRNAEQRGAVDLGGAARAVAGSGVVGAGLASEPTVAPGAFGSDATVAPGALASEPTAAVGRAAQASLAAAAQAFTPPPSSIGPRTSMMGGPASFGPPRAPTPPPGSLSAPVPVVVAGAQPPRAPTPPPGSMQVGGGMGSTMSSYGSPVAAAAPAPPIPVQAAAAFDGPPASMGGAPHLTAPATPLPGQALGAAGPTSIGSSPARLPATEPRKGRGGLWVGLTFGLIALVAAISVGGWIWVSRGAAASEASADDDETHEEADEADEDRSAPRSGGAATGEARAPGSASAPAITARAPGAIPTGDANPFAPAMGGATQAQVETKEPAAPAGAGPAVVDVAQTTAAPPPASTPTPAQTSTASKTSPTSTSANKSGRPSRPPPGLNKK